MSPKSQELRAEVLHHHRISSDLNGPPQTHFDELDRQHRIFFEFTAEFKQAVEQGKGEELLPAWLERVWSYMAAHFATEDRLMTAWDYPGAAQHEGAHTALLNQLRRFERERDYRAPGSAARILQFVLSWEEAHINGFDRQLADYLRLKKS